MFTFSRLGTMGRFGNQLFQIAATIEMGIKHGTPFVFPVWEHASYFKHPIPQNPARLGATFIVAQRCFGFQDLTLSLPSDCVIDLHGYFQSYKYFHRASDVVRHFFEPHQSIAETIEATYGQVLRAGPTCIIVVRRGDYATHLNHPMQPASFYEEAMSRFDRETTFIVTSDDIAWCRENVRANRILYLPQETWALNFFVGTYCQHVITSNTTFGWWIAWLNKSPCARVVAAKHWFTAGLAHLDTSDLFPPHWATL
jgi:hypothetical protein